MKLDELNEPFLPGQWVWLKQPPAFMAEECERCYSIWNYSRLVNELKGEDIDPRAPGKDDTQAFRQKKKTPKKQPQLGKGGLLESELLFLKGQGQS